MSEQYVTKTYGQRTSMVTSIPIGVRAKLGLTKGGHIVWQVDKNSNFVQISKLAPGVEENESGIGNSDRRD